MEAAQQPQHNENCQSSWRKALDVRYYSVIIICYLFFIFQLLFFFFFLTDPFHPHYLAGQKAVEQVFGVKPDLTREGGSIPVTLTFQVKFC